MQYKLTYFDVRALAEPIRLIFALKGIEFEDIRLNREDWPKVKSEYFWGTLPVLQDGDLVVNQSGTIQRYLGKKLGLEGTDESEQVKCDEIIEAVGDIRLHFFKAHFFEGDAAKKEEMFKTLKEETLPKYLKKFEEMLASNGDFFVGKQVTYADLNVASYLQIFNDVFAGTLDGYPNVKAHQDRIFNLDGIKQWVASRPVTQL